MLAAHGKTESISVGGSRSHVRSAVSNQTAEEEENQPRTLVYREAGWQESTTVLTSRRKKANCGHCRLYLKMRDPSSSVQVSLLSLMGLQISHSGG